MCSFSTQLYPCFALHSLACPKTPALSPSLAALAGGCLTGVAAAAAAISLFSRSLALLAAAVAAAERQPAQTTDDWQAGNANAKQRPVCFCECFTIMIMVKKSVSLCAPSHSAGPRFLNSSRSHRVSQLETRKPCRQKQPLEARNTPEITRPNVRAATPRIRFANNILQVPLDQYSRG